MDAEFTVPLRVLNAYGLDGARIEALPGGRTNRTMHVRVDWTGSGNDLVLQQVLASGHGDLLGIMENLVRVTAHLDWRRSINKRGESWYPCLVPTGDGKPFLMTEQGDVWRAFAYQEGEIRRSAQPLSTLAQAASLYGRFAAETADLGGPPLIETAPGFHDLALVHAGLVTDVEHARADRGADLQADLASIDALKARIEARCNADDVRWRADRVVHNDTKLSNVLFDFAGQAVSVLDLDLAMMGPSWHDVGDLFRSACWHAPAELGEPGFSPELFDTVAGAFVREASDTLSDQEIATYAAAGPRITLELGMRYLNDPVRTEPRLRVEGKNGHLLRGRANVNLAEEMLNAYDALRLVVDGYIADR